MIGYWLEEIWEGREGKVRREGKGGRGNGIARPLFLA